MIMGVLLAPISVPVQGMPPKRLLEKFKVVLRVF